MKRWATILMAALAVLGTAGPLAHPAIATSQDAPATAPATQATSPEVDFSDPQALGTILRDPATHADQREFAAQRLLAIGSPEAIAQVAAGLHPTAGAAVQLAAASAIINSGRAESRLVEPLLNLLTAEAPVNVKREVGRALSIFRSDPGIRTRLAELAISGTPTSTRQGAIAGLARIPAKSSAQALMLMLDGDQPESLEREAAEALRIMTGQDFAPDDLAGWQQWWRTVEELDETVFKARLLDSRAADAYANARRADAAAAALLATSQQRYRTLGPAQQVAMLEEFLRSPTPELREVGARLVLFEEVNYARDVPSSVIRLVRAAITDSDPRVRTVAALIFQRSNDATAVEPLLAQVGSEETQSARLEQVRALGALQDQRSLPTLLGLLTDRSPAVRSASARASASVANIGGPGAVRQAAGAIRQAFEAADPRSRAGQRQRADLIAALAELRDPSLSDFYRRLLASPTRPPREVLIPALRGVANLGDTNMGDIVIGYLTHQDAGVREQAVRAVAKTSLGFERAPALQRLLSPSNEDSETVRQTAWNALVELFPKARETELSRLAEDFRKEAQHERRLVVIEALAEIARRQQDSEQLAWRQHEMAEALMNDLNRPGEAAERWRLALDWSLANGPAATIQTRAENLLKAYLRARRFDDAISFAREMISRDRSFEQRVGFHVKREAESFSADGAARDARALIDVVLRQEPPVVDARSRSQLEQQRNALPADGL